MLPQYQFSKSQSLDQDLLEKLRRLMAPEAFVVLLESFMDRTRIHLNNAERCMADGDLEKLKFTIHTLKGSSANVGVRELSQLCADLEKQLKQGATPETVAQLLKQVSAEYEFSRKLLVQLTQTLQQTG